MTIDERLVFLLQSTESLHSSIYGVHESLQSLKDGIESLKDGIQGLKETTQLHTKQLEIDSDNIRRLANIAESHERRLDDLETSVE